MSVTAKFGQLGQCEVGQHAGLRANKLHWRTLALAASLTLGLVEAQAGPDLSRLQSVRDAIAPGGWAKVSLGTFSSSWVPPEQRDGSYMTPSAIVQAWASVAWDSNQGQLMLWGGGHANYMGNDMYLWGASSGNWSRGSLASSLTGPITLTDSFGVPVPSHYFAADGAAPQSAHTYDNSVFLRQNNLYLTFGGAAFNSGGGFLNYDATTGQATRAGAWMWDPTKADGNLTGGISGSLVDSFTGGVTAGNQMWLNRAQALTSDSNAGTGDHVNGTSAYRIEANRDVVYLTQGGASSGYRDLYRYEVGANVRAGDLDKMTLVGASSDFAPAAQATATIDTKNNLYVHTIAIDGFTAELGVWDLSDAALAMGTGNLNRPIELVREDGTPFVMTVDFAIEFDAQRGKFVLRDARDQGLVWETEAAYDAAGGLLGTWTIKPLFSTSLAQPSGALAPGANGASPFTGVQGKWVYVPELQAFLALNEFNTETQDAEVWLYRPLDGVPSNVGGGPVSPSPINPVATVATPASPWLVLAALGGLWASSRRRASR